MKTAFFLILLVFFLGSCTPYKRVIIEEYHREGEPYNYVLYSGDSMVWNRWESPNHGPLIVSYENPWTVKVLAEDIKSIKHLIDTWR